MSGPLLYRLAGAALASSGILATIGFSVHPHDASGANHGPWVAAHVVILGGCFLGLLGLVGLYLGSAERAGWAGFCGFLLAAVSLAMYLGKLYWSGFIYPLVMEHGSVCCWRPAVGPLKAESRARRLPGAPPRRPAAAP